MWSAKVIAIIASPMGTKRGSRQGSCRPLVAMVVGAPSLVTVSWGWGRLLVGLMAQRRTMGMPEEMPPSMPPWRLVRVMMFGRRGATASRRFVAGVWFCASRSSSCSASSTACSERSVASSLSVVCVSCSVVNVSLFSLPRIVATSNPAPYSTPSTAGRLNIALPRSALSLSNTGSPQPAGTCVATSSATPPTESCSLRMRSISAIIWSAISMSGQRTMLDSTCSSVTVAGSSTCAISSPIWRT